MIDEDEQFEVFVSCEAADVVQDVFVGGRTHLQDLANVVSHLFEIVDGFLLFFLLLLVQGVVFLADVLDELYNGLIVVIIDTIFNLLVVDEGVEVVQEGLKELRNAVFDNLPLQYFANDELRNEFHVT